MSTQTAPIKIALADDHLLFRDVLATVIDGFEECRVILLAANGRELLEKLQPARLPDIVILDVNMPRMNGYEAARQLHIAYPGIFVLILTMYDSEMTLLRFLSIGARGFLRKDIHPLDLRSAIQSVAETGYSTPWPGSALLNEKEHGFLRLVGQDLSFKEIAGVMDMTSRAMDRLIEGLQEKLKVKGRLGLAVYAIQSGLITREP